MVVNGAGSAGVAITKLLLTYGFPHVTMCDINGIIGEHSENLNWMQREMAEVTNLEKKTGTLADALKGADIFVGVSAPGIVTKEMVSSMNRDSILFAMANPVPEIMPDLAREAGARVVGTGRSDFPNQVNNVVAFPGIFRGALEGRATQITEEMKLAAAHAIAGLVPEEELNEENILPEAFDPRVADVVSRAVKDQHPLSPAHPVYSFYHVNRKTDSSGLIRQRSCYRLFYPPGSVGAETVALCIIKLFHRFHQADISLLNQIQKAHPAACIALCNADYQPEIGLYQLLACMQVS